MKQAMTKEEVIDRLNAIDSDIEMSHTEADSLLLDALLIAKMGDIVTAYLEAKRRIGFLYA